MSQRTGELFDEGMDQNRWGRARIHFATKITRMSIDEKTKGPVGFPASPVVLILPKTDYHKVMNRESIIQELRRLSGKQIVIENSDRGDTTSLQVPGLHVTYLPKNDMTVRWKYVENEK